MDARGRQTDTMHEQKTIRKGVYEMGKNVISILVKNEAGVLSRVSGLFSRRGFNIDSLSVGKTVDPEVSRITITMDCDKATMEQMLKQSRKLYVVIGIEELPGSQSVTRELALIKVRSQEETRSGIREVAAIFRANIIDVATESMIVEITGDEDKIDAFVRLLEPYGIIEMTRTGLTGLQRGNEGMGTSDAGLAVMAV